MIEVIIKKYNVIYNQLKICNLNKENDDEHILLYSLCRKFIKDIKAFELIKDRVSYDYGITFSENAIFINFYYSETEYYKNSILSIVIAEHYTTQEYKEIIEKEIKNVFSKWSIAV